jgi:phosphatidate cytidylyltransferase
MLRLRVITAVVLIAVLLAALMLLSPVWFDLVVLLVVAAGGWEWSALAGVRLAPLRIGFVSLLVLSCGLLPTLAATGMQILLLLAVIWWPLAFFCLVRQPHPVWVLNHAGALLAAGWLVLVPAWLALHVLQRLPGDRLFNVLWCIAVVAAADIGAYFAGKTFGRRKLAPLVSPNKTWEGLVGGVVATWAVMLLGARLQPGQFLDDSNLPIMTLATLLLAGYSVVGDLFESLLKRRQNLKDSGNLLPGHGGVMDRLDSLTAVLPLFVLLLWQVTGSPA